MAWSEAAIHGTFDFRTRQGWQACCLIAFEQKRVAKQSWCLIPFVEPVLEPTTTNCHIRKVFVFGQVSGCKGKGDA
jgi:hypothetical protein